MRDSVEWLEQQGGRNREIDAIAKVLDFRLRAASAAYRVRLDVENIEELFSLASASAGANIANDVTLAIAATLDFSVHAVSIPKRAFPIPVGWPKPKTWAIAGPLTSVLGGIPFQSYACPVYEAYILSAAGYPNIRGVGRRDTFISFNYDLVVEDSLSVLGIPFSYGFGNDEADFTPSARCSSSGGDDGDVKLLKLHGSINWALPTESNGKMTVYGGYEELRAARLIPTLVPPTWRKTFGGPLSIVWDQAVASLKTATRVIVIGYSMPSTDQHFKYLLAAGLQENISLRKIAFVNPAFKNSADNSKSAEADELEERVLSVLLREHVERKLIEFLDWSTMQLFLKPEVMNRALR